MVQQLLGHHVVDTKVSPTGAGQFTQVVGAPVTFADTANPIRCITLTHCTVNDIFTVVRGVWANAFQDGLIRANPLERITNVERDALEDTADPFTREELERIAAVNTTRRGDINMIMFCCWSGLSLSEVIALAWEDIDTVSWKVKVNRARVLNQYKVPKERGRVRIIELIEPARLWLKDQMQYTMMQLPIELNVKQRDNITTKKESVRFCFLKW